MSEPTVLLGMRPRLFSFHITEHPCVYVVVLTGGPSGGKSTAMGVISDRLKSFGFQARG